MAENHLISLLAIDLIVNTKNFIKVGFMNYNILTIKSQEVIQNAFTIAAGYSHQAVENGHILRSIQENAEDIIAFIFGKIDINANSFKPALDRILETYPKVSGGDQYISNTVAKVFTKAELIAKEMGDQYVSIEHILIGMLSAGDSVSQLLKDYGISEKTLKKLNKGIKKGQQGGFPEC